MEVFVNKDITSFNTFGLPCIAAKYSVIRGENDLWKLTRPDDLFILGGGSNVLLPERLEKWVLHNNIDFVDVDACDENNVLVHVGAGVDWHRLVTICVRLGWGGIENLALIPGSVGAAPVQNIGAYGVELKDVFVGLKAHDLNEQKMVSFNAEDCAFGYRNSIFKTSHKGRFIITSVTLKLHRNNYFPNLSYYALKEECAKRGAERPTIEEVYDMVVSIRSRKLPDPDDLGNSGSFFKNPVIGAEHFRDLKTKFADLKYYELGNDEFKIPAGYLIESCGWKGKRIGNVGCYEKQALVVVNYGGATASEVMQLVEAITSSVKTKFRIHLETEVNII